MNIYLKKFIEAMFREPGTALDLGAGDFFDVACLRQLGWKCEGVDLHMGVDLERPYRSKKGPFNLVFSNYLLHRLKNKKQLVKTAFNNLKRGGWFFVHTFDASDHASHSSLNARVLETMLATQGFTHVKTRVFSFYDNEDGHKHWHKILQATAQKQ